MNVNKQDTAQALAKALARKEEAQEQLLFSIKSKNWIKAEYWYDQLSIRADTYEQLWHRLYG